LRVKLFTMEKQEERDELGNVKFPKLTEEDQKRLWAARYTYIFHYYDEKREDYLPYFGLVSSAEKRMVEARKDSEFLEVELYPMPEKPPYSWHIRHGNSQLETLVYFFKDVLDEQAFSEGHAPGHKYTRFILSKTRYAEIMNVINDYGLLPLRELLLEVIARAEEKYIDKVSFWNKKEMQDVVKNAKAAAAKAIYALEKLDDTAWGRGEPGAKPPSEIEGIHILYNDETVKIEHSWLAREFIDDFRRAREAGPYKDWRKDLKAYHLLFDDATRLLEFQGELAWSYYNLLTGTGLIKVTPEEKTPNVLVECIAALMTLSSIPIGKNSDVMSVQEKAKYVRTWLNRQKLEQEPTHVEIKPDLARLEKYFDNDFLSMAEQPIGLHAFSIANFISYRFDIPDFLDDLAHITQALIDNRWLIGSQLLGGLHSTLPQFEEFTAWRTLIAAAMDGRKITSLKFTVEGSDQEFALESAQPLDITGHALREYAQEHPHDLDVEAVPTRLRRLSTGDIAPHYEPQFQDASSRFPVRFVTALYDYLLKEIPAQDHHFRPSEFYYAIIASVMAGAKFFNRLTQDEKWMIQEVQRWHLLGLAKREGAQQIDYQ